MNYDNFVIIRQLDDHSTVWVDDEGHAAFCPEGSSPADAGSTIAGGVTARDWLDRELGLCPVCGERHQEVAVVLGWDSKTNRPATVNWCMECALEDGWYDERQHAPEEAAQIAQRLRRENTEAWFAQRHTEEQITITRHAFVAKAPNVAKYGADAPKEGYINTWQEEIPAPATREEWDAVNEWLREEYEQAKRELDALQREGE
jgi:hypothetical protein